jgi:FkbM family methyltransferase
MDLKAIIRASAKRALAATGRDIIRRDRYGYDPYLDIERLAKILNNPVSIVFDVGANDGGTISAVRKIFPASRIISFEPHPVTFARLTERTKGWRDIELVQVALGEEHGKTSMFEYDLSVLNSLVPNAEFTTRYGMDSKTIEVNCTTLDRFCTDRGINSIDLLKIDTEGYDAHVLRGATSMLRRGAVKFVYFEYYDVQQRPGVSGGALLEMDEVLRPHGFRYIASYNDFVRTDGELFQCSNALYALPQTEAGSAPLTQPL